MRIAIHVWGHLLSECGITLLQFKCKIAMSEATLTNGKRPESPISLSPIQIAKQPQCQENNDINTVPDWIQIRGLTRTLKLTQSQEEVPRIMIASFAREYIR